MPTILLIRMNWNRSAIQLREAREYYNLDILPEPGWPFGRKGYALAAAWSQLSDDDMKGMLILDGDVAVDPQDRRVMLGAIHVQPDIVHVAPARIWPVSTKRADWVWAHWADSPSQDVQFDDIETFTLCYTYLPRKLIEASLRDGLPFWTYPGVDANFCRVAEKEKIPVNVVLGCQPKHLNY